MVVGDSPCQHQMFKFQVVDQFQCSQLIAEQELPTDKRRLIAISRLAIGKEANFETS